jgi:hypothetical protein
VAPLRPLGEDQRVIHRNLEESAGGRDQLDVGIGIRLLQLSRQTGGSGLVVSDDAELDTYAHQGRLSAGGRVLRES